MTEVEILQTPTKSESDKNEYRLIKLSNGLRALLIKSSITTLDKEEPAAVSLIVNVGFFDDPKSAQGLAHFLEHLLFLGSEKYQGESEFDSFLGLHSGYSNALTRDESTEYYLTVSEENLAEALDRFAQNLMSPLLKMSAMQREREAVDSEFQGSFFNDRARKFNLFQTFLNENHPASFEKTGNLKTLKDVISEEELHGEIVKLHQKYVAQKMCLVLQSTKELDQQQEIVAKNFSAIKAGEREISEPQPLENIFKPEFSSKMAFMKPKTTLKALSITWALPPMQKYYKSAPLTYIKKIFQNTSEGSLSRYLESNQLITSMRFDDNSCSMYSSPELYTEMTDLGSENIETILKAIFSYLLMIRNTSTNDHLRLYNDFKDLQEVQFKYRTKKDASQNVEHFRDTMLIVDDVDILRGSSMFQKFDEKLITDTINRLNQRKFNIIIIDDSHGHFPKIQQQYDVEYDLVDFPQSFQKLWNERKIDPKFFLERSNPFKATNFEIHSNESESMKYPVKIMNDSTFEVWHKLDSEFLEPRASLKIRIFSPKEVTSIDDLVLLKLLEHIISQNLLKFSSQSSAAGIRSYLSVIGKAFVLTVDGFSDSLQKLVELTIDEIKSSVKDIKKTNFDTSKQIMKQNLQNFLLSAQNAGVDLFEEVLNHNHFCRHDVYLNLADVLLKELQTFSDRFFKAIKVQALSQGNITNEKTLQIMEIFRTKFNIKPLQLRKYPRSRAYQIPYGTNMIRMSSFATDDENSFSIDFYQIGRGTYRTVGLVQLLATILDEEAFDFLRTKEQLGYSVSVSFRETKGIVGIAVMLQSQEKKHNFKKISERMEFFMKEIASKKIREMTDDEFKDYKESKIKSLAVQRNTMFGEFHANWSEITKQRYLFNSHEIQAKITQNISKIEFQSFFETCFKPEKIRKLCIQVIGNDQSEASSEKISDSEKFMPKFLESEGNCIEDLYEFQNGLMIYPGRKDLSGDLKK